MKIASSSLLQNNDEKLFFDDFMTYGWYKDKDIVNLINLNALSELITLLKSKNEFSNSSTKYIHDHISEFEATFKTELCEYDVDLSFEDSKDSLLLQLVDNFTSIVAHSYNRMISNLRHNKQWLQSSEWDMLLVSRLFRLVSTDNIKLTVPLSDFSATLCLMDMFASDYYPINRNNCCFDYLYNIKMRYIIDNIRYYSLFNSIIDSILKK